MSQALEPQRDVLAAITALKDKLHLQLSTPAIFAIIQRYPCPARAKQELLTPTRTRVDSLYSVRHRFLQKWLVDELSVSLTHQGYRVRMVAEARTTFGTGDIDIRVTGSTIMVASRDILIREEVKGGNFEFDQIVRYLMDADHVVTTLGARGTAFQISKEEAESLVGPLQALYVQKMNLLMREEEPEKIPGRDWCGGCSVSCPHALPEYQHTPDIHKEFVEPSSRWAKAIEKAVAITIVLIKQNADHDTKTTPQLNNVT